MTVIRQTLHAEPGVEHKLSQCSNLTDLRKLIAENEEKNSELVKKSSADTVSLMISFFERLSLKINKIEICQPIADDEVEAFFQANHRLDKELTVNEINENLDRRSKLKDFWDHSSKKPRNYSVKKYGDLNCKTCLPPRLSLQTFQKLHHLADPIPHERNEGHYNCFSDVFGKTTAEEHRSSKKLAKKNSPGIPFNPSKQHAINTNLIIECTKCNKSRIVYAQKKIPVGRVRAFKRVTHDLLFVCGSRVEELVGP